jgi:hypothetical protein
MDSMFSLAAAFNQNLAAWNVLAVDMPGASPPAVARSSPLRPHWKIPLPRRPAHRRLSAGSARPRPAAGTLQP